MLINVHQYLVERFECVFGLGGLNAQRVGVVLATVVLLEPLDNRFGKVWHALLIDGCVVVCVLVEMAAVYVLPYVGCVEACVLVVFSSVENGIHHVVYVANDVSALEELAPVAHLLAGKQAAFSSYFI